MDAGIATTNVLRRQNKSGSNKYSAYVFCHMESGGREGYQLHVKPDFDHSTNRRESFHLPTAKQRRSKHSGHHTTSTVHSGGGDCPAFAKLTQMRAQTHSRVPKGADGHFSARPAILPVSPLFGWRR